jgi:hypothetical protein
MVLVTLFSAACGGSDCEVACEAAKECPQVPPQFASLDCSDACDYQQDTSESAGCGAQFDAFNACGAENADRACEANVCSAEATTWGNCISGEE